MKIELISKGKLYPVEVEEKDGRLRVSLAGEPVDLDVSAWREGGGSILLAGRAYEPRVEIQDRQVTVQVGAERFCFEVAGPGQMVRAGSSTVREGRAEVKAPMPGKVVKVLVSPGEAVEAGQGLLLFEAMKMQNEIRSPLSGKVVEVVAREGQAVESRDTLLTVEVFR